MFYHQWCRYRGLFPYCKWGKLRYGARKWLAQDSAGCVSYSEFTFLICSSISLPKFKRNIRFPGAKAEQEFVIAVNQEAWCESELPLVFGNIWICHPRTALIWKDWSRTGLFLGLVSTGWCKMRSSVSEELLGSMHPHLPAWSAGSVWAMEDQSGSDAMAC